MSDHILARAAIRTRFHGATNSKPARISAYREGFGDTIKAQRVSVSYAHGEHAANAHAIAAQAFADKFLRDGATIDTDSALCFDGDYYWTWNNAPRAN